jgi:predicted RNA-binding protein YlqC (UPF0109 family)
MNQNQTKESAKLEAVAAILTDTIKAVVKRPEFVQVKMQAHGPLVAFVIKTDKDDVRLVIGRGGKHFKALTVAVNAMVRSEQVEAQIIIDEKNPPVMPTAVKTTPLGALDMKKFSSCGPLLHRIVEQIVVNKDVLKVKSTDYQTTAIFEVTVKNEDFPLIYGAEIATETGTSGMVIEALKNIFDGVGKNYGRVIRIAVSRV